MGKILLTGDYYTDLGNAFEELEEGYSFDMDLVDNLNNLIDDKLNSVYNAEQCAVFDELVKDIDSTLDCDEVTKFEILLSCGILALYGDKFPSELASLGKERLVLLSYIFSSMPYHHYLYLTRYFANEKLLDAIILNYPNDLKEQGNSGLKLLKECIEREDSIGPMLTLDSENEIKRLISDYVIKAKEEAAHQQLIFPINGAYEKTII